MSGNSRGAKKGAATKLANGFDFGAAGAKGGRAKNPAKGLANPNHPVNIARRKKKVRQAAAQ